MKKILIIDYDQSSLASLQGVFAAGYDVVTAADGQSGWDKYNKECPDLVLMEAMLPKVHGFELCQRITSEKNTRATVFIMTGVYKDRVYRTEALRTYGAAEYFEKPLKMADLVASVEAVLGKPEVRPAARPAAAASAAAPPPREVRAEAAPAEPHRRPKADDSLFALPEDLDRLSRELPKGRKPAAPRPDPSAEQKFEAMADELLKTVIVESTAPKTVTPKPGGGNGNGNGNGRGGADIDQFLKSALADLEFDKAKAKAAKPAPQPAPVVPVKPAAPPAPPVRPVQPEPKPAPPKPPRTEKAFASTPAADMKNTLTPGDPGSDISPFYTPGPIMASKPPVQAEKKPAPAPRPAEIPKPAPARPRTEKPEAAKPVVPAAKPPLEEAPALGSRPIFHEMEAPVEKKGPSKIIVIGLGVAALAAIGFFLLRSSKRPAPVEPQPQETAGTMTSSETPSQPVQEAVPPPVKAAPVKPKPQPQVKPTEQAGAQAILPAQTASLALPPPGNSPGGEANGKPDGTKTEDPASPAVKTGTEASQTPASGTDAAPGSAPAAVPSAPVQVHEGDLVELAAVTEAPRLTKKVDPIYPQTAQRVGRAGAITVNALIDEKGNVADTTILKGIQDDKGLARAAETAIRKWKFQPARVNGVAVKVWKPFVITFKADANPAN